MFIWTRTKLVNYITEALRNEMLEIEKNLGHKLNQEFGLDPYVLGYLSVTSSILAEIKHKRPTTIIDKIVLIPKCIQGILKDISPIHKTIHKIINDQENSLFREGTKAAAEVMQGLYEKISQEPVSVPVDLLSKDYRTNPDTYPSKRYFINYLIENRNKFTE